jgi:hypothetical protein
MRRDVNIVVGFLTLPFVFLVGRLVYFQQLGEYLRD